MIQIGSDLNYNMYCDTDIYNNQTINYLIHISNGEWI